MYRCDSIDPEGEEVVRRLTTFLQILLQGVSSRDVDCQVVLHRGRVSIYIHSRNDYSRYKLNVDNDYTQRWLRLCSSRGIIHLDYKPNYYNGSGFRVEDYGMLCIEDTQSLVEFIRLHINPYLPNISPYTPINIDLEKVTLSGTDFINMVTADD